MEKLLFKISSISKLYFKFIFEENIESTIKREYK